MDIGERYGGKRAHQRPGPPPSSSTANKVCYHWQAGRCNRHPCPFLHAEPSAAAPDPPAKQHRGSNIVWRNPSNNTSTINGSTAPPAKWGKGPRPYRKADRVCNYFISGKCTYGESCRFLHQWFVSDSFTSLTNLQGHEKVVTGIVLPTGSDKLYSVSNDESMRIWDCQSGQCVIAINLGGEIGCIISEGPWIFVGIPNAVKAWNSQTSAELSLSGPVGQVYAMVVGSEFLFAGTQDGRILVWRFSAVGNCFEPAASLTGHKLGVVTMVVGAMRLYSGSMDHTIRVWDLTTLQCVQTLTDHTSVIMSVLCWDQFLLSCSIDKTIKVWVAAESGNLEATYTHEEEHGILTLCGMPDAQGKPVLICSCNDNSVRFYDLPSFSERGKIFSKGEVRAIEAGPGGLFFTGDATGELKVWKWLTDNAPTS